MECRIASKFTVQPRNFEQIHIEAEWSATHQDLGYTDDDVVRMSDTDRARLRKDLELEVRQILWGIIKPQLEEANAIAEFADNLAAKVLNARSHNARSKKSS